MSRSSRAALSLLALLVAGLAVAPSAGQDEPPRRRRDRRRPPASMPTSETLDKLRALAESRPAASGKAASGAATSATASEPAREKDHYLAVINGEVHTISGAVLPRTTVLCKNGKIIDIGSNVVIPPEAEVVDAADRLVYPGLIAAAPCGNIHGNEPPDDTTDVFNLNMNIAVAVGITTAVVGNTAAKLTYGAVEDMVVKRNLYVSLGYSSYQPDARRELRADLDRVRQYLRDLDKHEAEKAVNKDAKPPDKEWIRDKFERYLKLLKREAIAVANANTQHELVDWADLAAAYGFRLVVRGAYEGWIVPDRLGRAGVAAVVSPRQWVDNDDRFMRPNGSTIENARILHDRGVPVAIMPQATSILTWGVGGRDMTHLNMEAAFAVRGGMSNDDAVRCLTVDAARILGVDDRVGSIETGKDADLIVCDGDVLHYMTQVHYTIVNGRVAYDKSKETLFGHIRPEGKPAIPQFKDAWPRSLEWPSDG